MSRRVQGEARNRESRTMRSSFGGLMGPSLVEGMRNDLDKAMARYLKRLDEWSEFGEQGDDDYGMMRSARGVVHGLAKAVGRMECPYEPVRGRKRAEKASLKRVRSSRRRDEMREE